MSIIGKIQGLFSDREKTQPIFPITKTKAVSDDNGVGLDVLLADKASESFVTNKIAEVQDNTVPKFDLLWSNGSPGNGWGATNITLGAEVMNKYSWLMITYRSHKGSAYYQRQFIPVVLQSGLSTSQRVRLETVIGGGYYRDITISSTGLTFTNSKKYDDSTTSNEYCTPMQIHGCNFT